MPQRPTPTAAHSSRDKWLWPLLGFLLVGQIVAFWMLCQNQVNQAQARHTALHAESSLSGDRMAMQGGAMDEGLRSGRADRAPARIVLVDDVILRQRQAQPAD